MVVTNFITQKYSRQGLWSLFLMCAFPLHLWTLIMVFRDVSWLTERTNVWDAIGVVSYAMIFALTESVIVFLVVALLGLFTPNQWDSDRRIAFLSLLVLITSLWAMIAQLLFIWNVSLPNAAIQFLLNSGHPVRIMYAVSLVVVTPAVIVPVHLFLRSERSVAFMQNLIERFSLLTMFYLVFDLLGLVNVVLRNIN